MKVFFYIKYRNSIFLRRLLWIVSLQSNLLLCWHGFYQSPNKVDPLCTAAVDSTELTDVRVDWGTSQYAGELPVCE